MPKNYWKSLRVSSAIQCLDSTNTPAKKATPPIAACDHILADTKIQTAIGGRIMERIAELYKSRSDCFLTSPSHSFPAFGSRKPPGGLNFFILSSREC